jgi:hypothetical protein
MIADHAKRWALGALVLSIVCIAWAIATTVTTPPVFGPMALVVTPGNELWVDVDGELWRTTAQGQLIERRRWETLGLPGAPANLLRHPDGGLVATVRRDSTLYRLDAQTGQVKGRLQPQWPAELQEHGGRAINLAFHPDGRFAVATGGGHAVALFDAQGAFMARTPADTYRFTNGLWWVGESLWSTDTNRTQLKRLDGHTLALQQTLTLPPRGAMQYLGPARAQAQMPASPDTMPRVGLIRFDHGMDRGTVTLLTADGQESALSQSAGLLPRDLEWLNGQLLLSDGESFSIKRWSPSGEALAPFGDAALQAALHSGLELREGRQLQRHLAFGGAAACWLIAGLLLWWDWRSPTPQGSDALDLSQLATPVVPNAELLRLGLRLHWPMGLALAPLLLLKLHTSMDNEFGVHLSQTVLFGAGGLAVVALLATPYLLRRFRRLVTSIEFEPLLNVAALRRLRSDKTLPGLLRKDEKVQETWIMQTVSRRWMVLTNQRLLELAPQLMGYRLKSEARLDEITAVSLLPGALTVSEKFKAARSRKGQSRLRPQAAWLEIALRDGSGLSGAVQSTPLAQRVAQRLAPKPLGP